MKSIVPPSLGAIISIVSSFDQPTLSVLEQLISGPSSTDPDDSELDRVAAQTGVSQSDLRYFLSFLAFLFAQTEDTPPQELEHALTAFLAEHGNGIDAPALAQKLLVLLKHREVQRAAAKRRRLAEGFLPNLVEVSHFVDLRSDFERDANGELTGRVLDRIPVIQLAIRTNSIRDWESSLVLQLDAEAVDELQSALSEIQTKLQILSRLDK